MIYDIKLGVDMKGDKGDKCDNMILNQVWI